MIHVNLVIMYSMKKNTFMIDLKLLLIQVGMLK